MYILKVRSACLTTYLIHTLNTVATKACKYEEKLL